LKDRRNVSIFDSINSNHAQLEQLQAGKDPARSQIPLLLPLLMHQEHLQWRATVLRSQVSHQRAHK
jgi:hypothetical protein